MRSHLTDAPLVMRAATLADAEPVWQCRQALCESVAIRSSTTDESYEAHVAWFSRAVNDPRRLFLIVEENERWLGYLRFDPLDDPTGYRVSIALVDDARGAGIGEAALIEGCTQAEQAGLGPLFADIGVRNEASHRIFQKCGFVPLNANISSDGFQRYIRCR